MTKEKLEEFGDTMRRVGNIEAGISRLVAERDHLREINAELLAALKRSEQYVYFGVQSCVNDGNTKSEAIARSDLEMVAQAIARAEKEDR